MAIVDFGLVLNDFNSLRHGVREGSRAAVVADLGTDTGCPVSPVPSATPTLQLVCLVKNRVGSAANTHVMIDWPGVLAPGSQLRVCAMTMTRSVSGMFGPIWDGKAVRTKVTMRVERPAPVERYAEALPAGQTWDWCA